MTATAHARPTSSDGTTEGAWTATAEFRAIGTVNRVVVTEPHVVVEAAAIARQLVADLDLAVSRFRPDSEVSRLAERARTRDAWCHASPTFAASLAAGLRAADLTGGLVDPTVGSAMVRTGYDADLDVVRSRRGLRLASAAAATVRDGAPVPGWRSIWYDADTGWVSVPRGTVIDLGATAKAYAADAIAERLAATLPGGFLVNLGGDIAVSGELPEGGWQVAVARADAPAGSMTAGPGNAGAEAATRADPGVAQVVTSTGQAFATSSTQLRTWRHGGRQRHHIVDPRTGDTARTVWAQVTCAGRTCLEANAASTAAIVLGAAAPAWLAARGIPARLDLVGGGRAVTTPGWPDPDGRAAA